ncbi:MAG: hypothetical protein ABII88_00185 [Candidatus Omnitrophota bacterium]
MVARIMSLLVVCVFTLTNVCFAAPAALQSSIVDNMALESTLKSAEGKAQIGALLGALAAQQHDAAAVNEIIAMWKNNMKDKGVQDEKALDAFAQALRNATVTGDQITMQIGAAQIVASVQDGKVAVVPSQGELAKELAKITGTSAVGRYNKEGNTSAQNQAGFDNLMSKAFATFQTRDMSGLLDAMEARINKNTDLDAAGKTAALETLAKLRAMNAAGNLGMIESQVEGQEQYVIAGSKDGKIGLSTAFFDGNELSAFGEQILFHEAQPEGSYADHRAAYTTGLQSKVYAEQIRDAGNAMRQHIDAQAPQAAAVDVDMNVALGITKMTETQADAILEKADIDASALDAQQKIDITTQILSTQVKDAITNPASVAARNTSAGFAKLTLTSTDGANAAVSVAALSGEEVRDMIVNKRTIALSSEAGLINKDGKLVPNTILAQAISIAVDVKDVTVAEGQPKPFNIINVPQANVEQLSRMFMALGIAHLFDVRTANEQVLADAGVPAANISVVYTQGESIANITGAFYLQLDSEVLRTMASGTVVNGTVVYDSLGVFMAAVSQDIQRLGLSAEAQQAYTLARAKGEVFNAVPQLTVANEAQYQAASSEYNKLVSLCEQA